MANLKNAAAIEALNEEEYINKLYDQVQNDQKKLLVDAFTDNTAALDTEKQNVQQQTDVNLERTDVEAQKVQQGYKPANVSGGVDQQVALTMGNQQKKNVSTLRDVQADADAEIERRRLLLGQQYAAAIKQAQADNDMIRAEQLYAEAKEKDAQIRALKTEAGKLLAETGDNSLLISLLDGGTVDSGSTGESWSEVFKNEGSINDIYDSANESARQQAESVTAAILSQLKAEQEQQTKETDRKLTQTYVNALQQGKNYDEVQNAYGLGSGNKAQAKLARAMGTTEDLAVLRGVQTGADASIGQKITAAIQSRNDTVTDAVTENERKRVQALYDAAAEEEQALIDAQKTVGQALAEQGDYSVLGKLYGLTQDQIDRLQGTGAYAPAEEDVKEETGGGSGSGGGGASFEEKEEKESANTAPVEKEKESTGMQSIIDLGYGPINKEGLADKVESGEVVMVPTENGVKYQNAATTQWDKINATTEAVKNQNAVFANAEANKKEETVLDKVADAVMDTKVGSAVVNTIVDAVDKATNPQTVSTSAKKENTGANVLSILANAFMAAAEKTAVPESTLKIPTTTSTKKSTTTKSSSKSGGKYAPGGKTAVQIYLRD